MTKIIKGSDGKLYTKIHKETYGCDGCVFEEYKNTGKTNCVKMRMSVFPIDISIDDIICIGGIFKEVTGGI